MTEIEAVKAARSFDEKVMRLLLDQRCIKVQISEGVVTAAAGNEESGKMIMKVLLDRRGNEARITGDVVTAAPQAPPTKTISEFYTS